MHSILATALFSLLPLSLAANIPITVGDGNLVFNPSVVTANVGDTLIFSFYPKSHSVVQSSFADPCHPLVSGGFFSGFQPLSAGPGPVDFVVQVNDTRPIWIYCSQTKDSHCQKGMAMVVNEPALPSPNTLDAYKLAAAKTGNSTSPSLVMGGIFVSRNSTSTNTGGNSTASSTGSSRVASSSGTFGSSGTGSRNGTRATGSSDSAVGSSIGSGAGSSNGTKSGSGSGAGSSSTTASTSQSSPIMRFKGGASRTATGLEIVYGAAALLVLAFV